MSIFILIKLITLIITCFTQFDWIRTGIVAARINKDAKLHAVWDRGLRIVNYMKYNYPASTCHLQHDYMVVKNKVLPRSLY